MGNKKDILLRKKLAYMALSSVLGLGTLSGCASKSNTSLEQVEASTKTFGVGEHIISVPIPKENDVTKSNFQYDYYFGYEPVGISTAAYGIYAGGYYGAEIVYANVEEVKCTSSVLDNEGNYLYLDFGEPINCEKSEYLRSNNIKEFGIGEHIISVPVNNDLKNGNYQYKYYEGYEVVGVASSAFGAYSGSYYGGALLYKNIVPVKCSLKNNGYTEFGQPYELEEEMSNSR